MSPRKVRLAINAVKGKSVAEARAVLSLMPKIAATPLLKLLESAVKNAANINSASDTSLLTIADFHVDGGQTLKRMMPRAHGSAYQILKRTSKVTLVLAEKSK